MIVRPASVDDSLHLAELAGQLGYTITPEAMRQRLSSLPFPNECVLVAEDSQGIQGWIQVGRSLAIESAPHAEIRGLIVRDTARGQGIGSLLVNAGARWATDIGLGTLRVRSNIRREDAHGFYRRLGFKDKKQQLVFEKTEDL